jgi:hypothetical protein
MSPGISGPTMTAALSAASHPPLTSIAERRDGSDSEEEDDEEEGGWKTATANATPAHAGSVEEVIKTGYLWKKGERRKVRIVRVLLLKIFRLIYTSRHGRSGGLCSDHSISHTTKQPLNISSSDFSNFQTSIHAHKYPSSATTIPLG